MSDIIATMAWQCGDKDCGEPGCWHKTSYWAGAFGLTEDSYSDGNHEPIDEDDLPSPKEELESWRRYAAWVLEHGQDPLENYHVKHVVETVQPWRFKVINSSAGPIVRRAFHGRREVALESLPERVKSYLNLKLMRPTGEPADGWVMQDFKSTNDLLEAAESDPACRMGSRPGRDGWTLSCRISVNVPRSDTAIARDLRRSARKHLSR